jgi:hypothetical protein
MTSMVRSLVPAATLGVLVFSAAATEAANSTTVGAVTTTVASCDSVRVTATFTGDDNQNGTTTIQYGAGAAPGAWTGACAVSGPSPRQCTVAGLTASTLYSFRASFADVDGVVGTNPTAGVPATTTACGADVVAPTITVLVPSRNAILSGADTVKVQVWDAGALAAPNPVAGQVDGTGAAGFTLVFAANASYSCGAGCSVYQYALPAQAAGAHYIAVRAADAAGNVSVVTIPFRAAAAAGGSGTLLRRTHGSQLCLDCHNLQTHSSQYTSTTYGNWAVDCQTCHTPHATTNIYLVRGTIETPASGAKPVDFRNTAGVAAYSYATPQASGSGVNVCEVCHTRTRNSDATPRARNNAATDWTKHYTGSCTGCHPHGKGFAGASESGGAATCAACHRAIWDGMTGGVAKSFKHALGNVLGTNDAFGDTAVTWGNPLSANAAAVRSCVNTCHNDHPHTLSAPATATHENNVYLDATTQASRAATTRTSADKDKTDFQSAAANGGMCLSCHRNPVDATHPAVDKAGYTPSAHNYTTFGAYGAWQYTQHDGSSFQRNCTKCHSDRNDTRPGASVTPFGAVHFSDYPSLLAGSTNPAGAPATFVCYDCHGNGTTGTDYSGKPIATQVAKTRNHPSNADSVHNSVTELAGAAFGNTLGVTGRHSSCLDCHETHKARAGTHATPGNLAGPPLEGSWGAQLSSNPAFWTAPASANFTKKTIVAGTDLEATLCFKCHSAWYGTLPASPSGGYAETDTAREFNPANVGNFAGTWANGETAGGFHPVLAAAGSNLGAVRLTNLVTTSFPWSATARNTMTCTDCHESDTTTDPNGPHGSTAGFILRGPGTTWNGTMVSSSTGMPAGAFCANCHSSTYANSRYGTQHTSRSEHRVNCWNCHARIPHGGPRPGMLIAPAGANANVGGTIAGWDTTAPYWGLGTSTAKLYLVSYPANNTTNWVQNNCGCNGTGH